MKIKNLKWERIIGVSFILIILILIGVAKLMKEKEFDLSSTNNQKCILVTNAETPTTKKDSDIVAYNVVCPHYKNVSIYIEINKNRATFKKWESQEWGSEITLNGKDLLRAYKNDYKDREIYSYSK